MALVGYSDSEASSDEDSKPKQQPKSSAAAKPSIQKVVDSANPRKIRVNLPEPTRQEVDSKEQAPRDPGARLGGSGFNAILPAPKRPAAASAGGGAAARGLGKGVNLKTGATPGFTREPMDVPEPEAQNFEDPEQTRDNETASAQVSTDQTPRPEPPQEPVKKGNPMMFKPLSVARNSKQKKKKPAPAVHPADSTSPQKDASQAEAAPQAKPKPPKVSLFSLGATSEHNAPMTEPIGDYTPMVYKTATTGEEEEEEEAGPEDAAPQASTFAGTAAATSSEGQSLDSIATDLNLSASARRQLFGRGGQSASAVNVRNFNTDQEWEHNEELRASGEQVQHNPVRALAPGKHSLKQLVSAVSSQRDALEESFAKGKANKKEAGSKYGW
jgi:hypothetical protein